MAERLHLLGYHWSVYTRAVRMTLAHLALDYAYHEHDPFARPADPALAPMGKVPVLRHDTFTLTETGSILRYLARLHSATGLIPSDPWAVARMDQVIGLVDAQGYWALVRQVATQRLFAPAQNLPFDALELTEGLTASARVLQMLEQIAAEGLCLAHTRSLADFHLAPMIAPFALVPEGLTLLSEHPNLSRWWQEMQAESVMSATDPGLAKLVHDA